MMAELFGRKTGYCKGKGGSMHIADFAVGMLGANGVVGGGYNIAVGAGMSAMIKKTDDVAVCFFGDGASNRGTFHEGINLAALWKLPVIFVNENNQWASTTPTAAALSAANVADRAKGYGIEGFTVYGNNVIEVYNAAAPWLRKPERERPGYSRMHDLSHKRALCRGSGKVPDKGRGAEAFHRERPNHSLCTIPQG